jgi:hypothetical protein
MPTHFPIASLGHSSQQLFFVRLQKLAALARNFLGCARRPHPHHRPVRHKPAISLGNSFRSFATIAATSSDRPMERRSPPLNVERMFVCVMEIAGNLRPAS